VFSARYTQVRLVMCRSSQTSDGDRYFNGIKVNAVLCSARVRCCVIDTWLSDGQLTAVVADVVTRPCRRVDDVAVTSPLHAEVVCLRRVSRGLARQRDVVRGGNHLGRRPVNYLCPLYNTRRSHNDCRSQWSSGNMGWGPIFETSKDNPKILPKILPKFLITFS